MRPTTWLTRTTNRKRRSSWQLPSTALQRAVHAKSFGSLTMGGWPRSCCAQRNGLSIQRTHDRGGGAVRENPARSLHWWGSQEVAMFATGQWWETPYAACTSGGARCKHQLLRHNVEEINRIDGLQLSATMFMTPTSGLCTPRAAIGYTLPKRKQSTLQCSHMQLRLLLLGGPRGPGKPLWQCLVCQLSPQLGGVSTGSRSTHVPSESGPWHHWQWYLGFLRPGLPVRAALQDAVLSRDTLPDHCVYVGWGSFHHRAGDQMESPWAPATIATLPTGWHSTFSMSRTSDLSQQLAELKGKTLVCDCPMKQMPSLGCTSMLVPCR